MVQFMRGLPRELDEAAELDGCGHLRIYWSIVLPLCRPALITSAIFTFINAWNDFMGPLIYLNDPRQVHGLARPEDVPSTRRASPTTAA